MSHPRPRPHARLFRRTAPPVPSQQAQPVPAPDVRVSTQVVPLWLILRGYQALLWLVCVLCFVITTSGNIGIFGADIRRALDPGVWQTRAWWLAVGLGCLMQLIVQVCQWATLHTGHHRAYVFFLLLSVVPSCITYLPLIVPFAGSRELWGNLLPWRVLAYILSTAAAVAFLIAVDVLQDRILVQRAKE